MFWPQIWFNMSAWLPTQPQKKPTSQNGQMMTEQPSLSSNMSSNMTPMSQSDMRLAGINDRMMSTNPLSMPSATEDAFPIDKIMAGFGTSFGGIPSKSEVEATPASAFQKPVGTQAPSWDMKQVIGELGATIIANPNANVEETKAKFPEFANVDTQVFWELGATIKAHPSITIEEVMQKFPELSQQTQWEPSMFDTARGKVDKLFWNQWTQIGWYEINPLRPMEAAANAWLNIAEGISEAYKRRQWKIDEIIQAEATGQQWATRSTLQWLWQAMWLGWDIIGEWFMGALKVLDEQIGWLGSKLLSKAGETQAAKDWLALLWEWVEKYNEIVEKNPELGRDLDAAFGAADFLFNFAWVGLLWKWAKEAKALTRAWVADSIVARTPLKEATQIARIAEEVTPWVSFVDKAISQIAKVDPQTANTLRKNKGLIVYGDAQWWTKETVAQWVVDTLEANAGRFGEAGGAYNAIRETAQQVDMIPIKNKLVSELAKEGITVVDGNLVFPSGLKKFDVTDQNIIKEAVEAFLKEWDVTDANKFLDGRMLLTKQAGFDRNVTKSKAATDYIKRLRGAINSEAKLQIGWLEQADAVYSAINENIDTLMKEFFKDWVQKGNIETKLNSIMRRLDSDPQKQALKRLIPDIEDKIDYLKVAADLEKSQWNKVATYMASTLPLWWFMAAWPIGWLLWFLASAYFAGWDVVKNLLMRFGTGWEDIASQIAKKVAKQEKLLANEQKMIQEAIENAKKSMDWWVPKDIPEPTSFNKEGTATKPSIESEIQATTKTPMEVRAESWNPIPDKSLKGKYTPQIEEIQKEYNRIIQRDYSYTNEWLLNFAKDYKYQLISDYKLHLANIWESSNYINPDDIRQFFNKWWMVWANITHDWASYLWDEMIDYAINTQKRYKDKTARIVAWWPASGKWGSSQIEPNYNFDLVIDKVWGGEIDRLVSEWYNVTFDIVKPNYDNILDQMFGRVVSWNEALGIWKWRATPMMSVWKPWHLKAVNNFKKFLNDPKYKDVDFRIISNEWAKEAIHLMDESLFDNTIAKRFDEIEWWITVDKLKKIGKEYLDSGKITKSQYAQWISWLLWVLAIMGYLNSSEQEVGSF